MHITANKQNIPTIDATILPVSSANPIHTVTQTKSIQSENYAGNNIPQNPNQNNDKVSTSSYDSGAVNSYNSTSSSKLPLFNNTCDSLQKCSISSNSGEETTIEIGISSNYIPKTCKNNYKTRTKSNSEGADNNLDIDELISEATCHDTRPDLGKDPTGRIADFLSSSGNQSSRARRSSGHQSNSLSLDNFNNFSSENLNNNQFSKKCVKSANNDRKSKSGRSGVISKNGGGGKYTWGKPGIEWTTTCPSGVEDLKDPNFDEFLEDENTVFETNNSLLSDEQITKYIYSPFKEFLINGDETELVLCFGQIDSNLQNISRLFFHLLFWGLETTKKSRGHVWDLIKMTLDLKGNYFQDNRTIFRALEDFFDARDELLLDCPNYDEYIQKMLGCLIYKMSTQNRNSPFDNFLKSEMHTRAKMFSKVVNISYTIADRIKSDSDIMSKIWTMDDYLTTEQLSYEMSKFVDDWVYDGFSSVSLVCDLKSSVKTPHFYHELIYQILIKSLTLNTDRAIDAAIETMNDLVHKSGIVSKDQVERGFLRIFNEMDDLELDLPLCVTLIAILTSRAKNSDLINEYVRVKMPRKIGDRRRAYSEKASF